MTAHGLEAFWKVLQLGEHADALDDLNTRVRARFAELADALDKERYANPADAGDDDMELGGLVYEEDASK